MHNYFTWQHIMNANCGPERKMENRYRQRIEALFLRWLTCHLPFFFSIDVVKWSKDLLLDLKLCNAYVSKRCSKSGSNLHPPHIGLVFVMEGLGAVALSKAETDDNLFIGCCSSCASALSTLETLEMREVFPLEQRIKKASKSGEQHLLKISSDS